MYRDEAGYFYHLDRASDAVDLGGGKWLYTVLSEERILRHCPDVRDCTVLAARGDDGKLVADVLLVLVADADTERDREGDVRAALGDVAAALPLRVVTIPDDELVIGATGKVRKFLMRQKLLASTGAASMEGSS
jgi:acyl-CoA synthetase (AMP-forming)/AMP-acid ligase II